MKILIIYDEEENELWYYISAPGEHPILVQPRREREDDEDDERIVHWPFPFAVWDSRNSLYVLSGTRMRLPTMTMGASFPFRHSRLIVSIFREVRSAICLGVRCFSFIGLKSPGKFLYLLRFQVRAFSPSFFCHWNNMREKPVIFCIFQPYLFFLIYSFSYIREEVPDLCLKYSFLTLC